MANEIKLEVYTFRIKPVNAQRNNENFLPLDDLGSKDFYDIFMEYLNELDILDVDDSLKKAIKLKTDSTRTAIRKRLIRGIFESGGYGIVSDIYRLADSKHLIKKGISDVEIMPFYFLVYIPKSFNVGILLVQRIGIYGISTVLQKSLYGFIRQFYEAYVIDFNPLVSQELAKNFLKEGKIKEIVLRKYSLPSDAADRLQMSEYIEDIYSVELRIKARSFFDGMTGKINTYLTDPNGKFFDIPELRKIGFEDGYKISVKSEFDGTTRTVDLTESMEIRPYYDIDAEVEKMEGHPVFDSIDSIAINLLDSLLNEQPS